MDKILESLVGQSPAVAALIWAIWYMGGKVDRLQRAIEGLRGDVRERRCKAEEMSR